ncbi:glycosyl transferase family 90 [Halobacteriovorax sp. RT-2-6]|uniref:glycosyl transferase family 90 n=1 Tax=unclassified Halobacteriovorax TaxID=2639665 RepID=UPI00399B542A
MKHFYYIKNAFKFLIPKCWYQSKARKILSAYEQTPDQYIEDRVSYYNKLKEPFKLELENENTNRRHIPHALKIKDFKKVDGTTYYFDILEIIRNFSGNYMFRYEAGDVIEAPTIPTIVKSRPVVDNENSVVLKLNKVRHFNFIQDKISFEEKLDKVVWRGTNTMPHRDIVIKQFYDHPLCDIGQTAPKKDVAWLKDFLSIEDQLHYKFILCMEGNDVATNLKWAMSSNSLCIMSKPKYETWFMEGRLVAGKHYVEVKDDYSDLPEKIEYYLAHPEEAKLITKNANEWVEQFKDEDREFLISLLVAKKYFSLQ